jgi:RNA-directed DNA polymerase
MERDLTRIRENFAITDNYAMCLNFKREVTRLLYKWLNRRSQRRSYDWERFHDALAWGGWPSVHILHNLSPFGAFVGSN